MIGVSQFEQPVGFILFETFQGHVHAANSLAPPYWSSRSCDLCRKEGFQSSYRSPAHMAALPNRCFSFAPLQSLSARRNGAKEVIHDARFFSPSLQSADTHCFLEEEWCRPHSILIDFLLLMTLHRIDIRSDGSLC